VPFREIAKVFVVDNTILPLMSLELASAVELPDGYRWRSWAPVGPGGICRLLSSTA
jgi:hypothetical protein